MVQSPTSLRTLGKFPLSVATSLALEGLLGIHPDKLEQTNSINDYDSIYINIRTLYRNLYGSLLSDSLEKVTAQNLYETLKEEMEMIKTIVFEQKQDMSVVYYYCDYEDIAKNVLVATLRLPTTKLQIEYVRLQDKVMKMLLKDNKDNELFKEFGIYVRGENENAIMLTNYPIDLTTYNSFRKLDLLESHTGNIKKRINWYTKFYNGKDLINIPFCIQFLIIFGDNILLKPLSKEFRESIIEIAKKYEWTQATTPDKIKYGATRLKNEEHKSILLSLF